MSDDPRQLSLPLERSPIRRQGAAIIRPSAVWLAFRWRLMGNWQVGIWDDRHKPPRATDEIRTE